MVRQKNLKLIYGGKALNFSINGLHLALSPLHLPPFPVESLIFEEDTNLILTVDKKIKYQKEHPINMMTNIHYAKSYDPGTLVINGKNWYAVVVDINTEEMCQLEWIQVIYAKVLNRIVDQKIHSIGINLLGSTHAKLDIQNTLNIFIETLCSHNNTCLKNIWLILAEHLTGTTAQKLQKLLNSKN